jgi:hypothetical protein
MPEPILDIPPDFTPLATTTAAQADLLAQSDHKPVSILITAQEIGAMTVKRYTPFQFNQVLLERFKHAGAPVEGRLEMRLAHGRIAKVKQTLNSSPEYVQYVWLPDAYVAAIALAAYDGPVS